MTVLELIADQEIRTEVYDALQGVFADHDVLVCPTLTAMQVKNGTDGNTLGPAEVNGVEIDRCIGWCPTYICNYSGHPAASIPAGFADGLPGGHADHGAPLRRRRRAGGERRVRARCGRGTTPTRAARSARSPSGMSGRLRAPSRRRARRASARRHAGCGAAARERVAARGGAHQEPACRIARERATRSATPGARSIAALAIQASEVWRPSAASRRPG